VPEWGEEQVNDEGKMEDLNRLAQSSSICDSKAPMWQGVLAAVKSIGRGSPHWSVVKVQPLRETASITGLRGSRP